MTKKIFKKFFRWLQGSSQIYIRQNNLNYEPAISYHINETGVVEIWIEAAGKFDKGLAPDSVRSAANERTQDAKN